MPRTHECRSPSRQSLYIYKQERKEAQDFIIDESPPFGEPTKGIDAVASWACGLIRGRAPAANPRKITTNIVRKTNAHYRTLAQPEYLKLSLSHSKGGQVSSMSCRQPRSYIRQFKSSPICRLDQRVSFLLERRQKVNLKLRKSRTSVHGYTLGRALERI
jgi:hypothetical protein